MILALGARGREFDSRSAPSRFKSQPPAIFCLLPASARSLFSLRTSLISTPHHVPLQNLTLEWNVYTINQCLLHTHAHFFTLQPIPLWNVVACAPHSMPLSSQSNTSPLSALATSSHP
uniref:Uncharacterized protein n=1 Tax=Physcomitrium patens TaxID=3218 RepID=A0A2K1IC54_PHYPA|nr:hypothetical protein PHYPA_030351 [Physcomitrium patens]PNR26871.1 hypothetical protein PHYPA_030352 [Physcomitrium patens]PNR26872.1 hypothetical protein PHYPA_030353 [Physcomitrium patens]